MGVLTTCFMVTNIMGMYGALKLMDGYFWLYCVFLIVYFCELLALGYRTIEEEKKK